jgi:hypothetical protein
MATLRIEHPITDFETWKAAFDRFAEAREIRNAPPPHPAPSR